MPAVYICLIIVGIPVSAFALIRITQLLLAHNQYQAILDERRRLLAAGVPPHELPPMPSLTSAGAMTGPQPEPQVRMPSPGVASRRPSILLLIFGIPLGILAVLLFITGVVMLNQYSQAGEQPLLLGLGAAVIAAVLLLSYARQHRACHAALAMGTPDVAVPEATPAERHAATLHAWFLGGLSVVGLAGLIILTIGISQANNAGLATVVGILLAGGAVVLIGMKINALADAARIMPSVGSLTAYLRAGMIALGVAGGIAAMAQWGRYETPEQSIASFALLPLVIGVALLVVHLVMSIMDPRMPRVQNLVLLAMLALACLAFPTLYQPDLPLPEQVRRLAIIPAAVIGAVLLSYLVQYLLPRRAPVEQDATIVLPNDTTT